MWTQVDTNPVGRVRTRQSPVLAIKDGALNWMLLSFPYAILLH
jgi:hypothetical protein